MNIVIKGVQRHIEQSSPSIRLFGMVDFLSFFFEKKKKLKRIHFKKNFKKIFAEEFSNISDSSIKLNFELEDTEEVSSLRSLTSLKNEQVQDVQQIKEEKNQETLDKPIQSKEEKNRKKLKFKDEIEDEDFDKVVSNYAFSDSEEDDDEGFFSFYFG